MMNKGIPGFIGLVLFALLLGMKAYALPPKTSRSCSSLESPATQQTEVRQLQAKFSKTGDLTILIRLIPLEVHLGQFDKAFHHLSQYLQVAKPVIHAVGSHATPTGLAALSRRGRALIDNLTGRKEKIENGVKDLEDALGSEGISFKWLNNQGLDYDRGATTWMAATHLTLSERPLMIEITGHTSAALDWVNAMLVKNQLGPFMARAEIGAIRLISNDVVGYNGFEMVQLLDHQTHSTKIGLRAFHENAKRRASTTTQRMAAVGEAVEASAQSGFTPAHVEGVIRPHIIASSDEARIHRSLQELTNGAEKAKGALAHELGIPESDFQYLISHPLSGLIAAKILFGLGYQIRIHATGTSDEIGETDYEFEWYIPKRAPTDVVAQEIVDELRILSQRFITVIPQIGSVLELEEMSLADLVSSVLWETTFIFPANMPTVSLSKLGISPVKVAGLRSLMSYVGTTLTHVGPNVHVSPDLENLSGIHYAYQYIAWARHYYRSYGTYGYPIEFCMRALAGYLEHLQRILMTIGPNVNRSNATRELSRKTTDSFFELFDWIEKDGLFESLLGIDRATQLSMLIHDQLQTKPTIIDLATTPVTVLANFSLLTSDDLAFARIVRELDTAQIFQGGSEVSAVASPVKLRLAKLRDGLWGRIAR